MRQIAAVCNQKGGTGKTTLTINLGAALADLGKRVLLIDFDPQGHLTEGVGLQELYLEHDACLYDFLIGKRTSGFEQLVHPAQHDQLSVIPSSFELMLAEQSLYMARNREHKLSGILNQLDGRFDWILIDCPPVLGNLTDNALNASRQVIVPIQAEATSVRALELLFDQIESVEKGLNIHIDVLAVVPNLVQDSALGKKILSDLRSSIPAVTQFELRKRVMLQAAWGAGHSIFSFDAHSAQDIRTRQEIIDAYRELAQFILQREEEVHAGG
jgi:chromosome partitioning protein